MAFALNDKLFDPETMQNSVRGGGKPIQIEYIKAKCFEVHPSTGNMRDEREK